MRIGYYFSHIHPRYGGIYQYALLVLKMLAASEKIEKLVVFYSDGQEKVLKDYFNNPKVQMVRFDKKGKITRLLVKTADFFMNRYYLTGRQTKFYTRIYKIKQPHIRFFNRFHLDVFHVPMQLSPVYHLNCPVIITMHDLQQMYFPEFFTPEERMFKSISYYMALNESDHILVSYDHVKNDIIRFFKIDEKKISVCLDPATEDWFYEKEPTAFEELQSRYSFPDNYMLTPAATWPHKNHIAVLQAIKALKDEGKEVFWVATGKKKAFYSQNIEPEIKRLGLEKNVLFTGLVPDSDLIGFYLKARFVVIPTLYEAGSGPLFEAMRLQVPVIGSNATTLPEHMGNDKFIFDPKNIGRIKEMIDKMWFDTGFRDENSEHLKFRFAYYSNMNFLEAFEQMYEQLKANK